MLTYIVDKIIGTKSERQLKKYQPAVEKINSLEKDFSSLTDDAL